MERRLKIKKDESLYKWIERIAEHYHLDDEMKDVLAKVSKVSYIYGSWDFRNILIKHKR